MNQVEHLLACLGEEASEVAQDVDKSLRFGLEDRNVEKPTGPTNRERLIKELNELAAVIALLVDLDILPKDWKDASVRQAKRERVLKFMEYARGKGALI